MGGRIEGIRVDREKEGEQSTEDWSRGEKRGGRKECKWRRREDWEWRMRK